MTDIILHIFDITNSGSKNTDKTIRQINNLMKDNFGIGGIFHGTIQVYGDETWSFGFCKRGSGVFSSQARKNGDFTYRESIVLGKTNFLISEVNLIIQELCQEWLANSYKLFSSNCCHFCDEFCKRLGVPKLPGWVNRFANAGDAAGKGAQIAASQLRQAKAEIISGAKVAFHFLFSGDNNSNGSVPGSPGNSNRGSPKFHY